MVLIQITKYGDTRFLPDILNLDIGLAQHLFYVDLWCSGLHFSLWEKPPTVFTVNLRVLIMWFSGAGAAEGGVDTTPHLHRGHFQHHRGAWHRHLERDPPQDGDDVQRLRPRLPRPQLPGQCALRTGFTGCDGGLSETRRSEPRGSWFRHVKRTIPSAVDLIKLDEKGKLELWCLARGLDVCECVRVGGKFLHLAESRVLTHTWGHWLCGHLYFHRIVRQL